MPNSSSSAKRQTDPSQEAFNQLLNWLDADRDRAGYRYEEIRLRLIKIFICRGCPVPEELADETMNRVASKVGQIAPAYVGDPASYFYAVASKIYLEYMRKRSYSLPAAFGLPPEDSEDRYACLENCMQQLSAANRNLILSYYGGSPKKKIDSRKELALKLGIGANALWIRVHRIRESLRRCVLQCFSRSQSVDGNFRRPSRPDGGTA